MRETRKSLFQLLVDTIQLDIYDLNYVYGSEKLGKLWVDLPPNEGSRKLGVLARIFSFLFHWVKSIPEILDKDQEPSSKDAVVFLVGTLNQKNSLTPIADRIDTSYFVGGSPYTDIGVQIKFPFVFAFSLSLLFFPVVFYKFLKSTNHRRITHKYIFDQYWLTYGYYLTTWYWLGRLRPRVIVVSSDHGMPDRVVRKVAKEKNISTVYVQHASVTENFPPLEFDYAFLEGYDALMKYDQAGPSETIVFLIGMAKFDGYINNINSNNHVSKVGICLNPKDPMARVIELCNPLLENPLGVSFILRPHPGDKRKDLWFDLASRYGFEISDPVVENSFEFFKRLDAIIAGNSNIILEAVLLNVSPIYFDFNESNNDWYGFIKNGLIDYSNKAEDVRVKLLNLITSKPFIREKAKIYCASIGTKYDGCSSQLAFELISQIALHGKIYTDGWKRIEGVSLEANTV